MSRHAANRAVMRPVLAAQYDWEEGGLRRALDSVVAEDAVFRLAHPFGDMTGPQAFHDNALAVLKAAWPDVERRDWLIMSGADHHGADWVGCGGHFIGTFAAHFLDIPPTGHLAHMRFHEFYRIADGKVTGFQAL